MTIVQPLRLTTWVALGAVEVDIPIASTDAGAIVRKYFPFLLTGLIRRNCAFRIRNVGCLKPQGRSDKATAATQRDTYVGRHMGTL